MRSASRATPTSIPVCAAILAFVNAGKKGSDVRRQFASGQYGWPQDAIDGALILLSVTGHLRVTQNGQPFDPRQLDHAKVGVCDFRTEHVTISAAQKLAIRKLFQAASVGCKPGEEAVAGPGFVGKVLELAEAAGGDAPRPEKPDSTTVKEIKALTGNEQLVKLYEEREALTQNITGLDQDRQGHPGQAAPVEQPERSGRTREAKLAEADECQAADADHRERAPAPGRSRSSRALVRQAHPGSPGEADRAPRGYQQLTRTAWRR